MLCLGETTYALSDVLRVLSGEPVKGASFAIGTLRLPRALAGLLAGLGTVNTGKGGGIMEVGRG